MKRIISDFVSLLSVKKCILCSLYLESDLLCEACAQEIEEVDVERSCVICSESMFQKGICECCKTEEQLFFQLRSFWKYTQISKEIIYQMKYKKNIGLIEATGREVAMFLLESFKENDWDLILPIPLSKSRIWQRGFNQCAILANAITKTLYNRKLSFIENTVLKRTKDTPPQSHVSFEKRYKNISGVFSVNMKLKDKKILLIDDVLTTGSTAYEAAKMLKASGATHIDLFTLARSENWNTARKGLLSVKSQKNAKYIS